jgi:uncharacterized protein YecT (DUF1311 family)
MWRFVLFLLASPAFAQDYWMRGDDGQMQVNEALIAERTLACWEGADSYKEQENCIGTAASDCMDLQPKWGQTTYGMISCTIGEANVWEQILETERQKTLEFLQDEDERDDSELNPTAMPYRVPPFKKVHETWLAYRQAKCNSASLVHRGGTLAPVVYAGCWLDETADQALFYWGLRGPW